MQAPQQDAIPGEAVFRFDGERIVGTPNAIGPWSAFAQHGSAPAALIAWAAERLETATPMRVARLTIDLIRLVPIGPIDVSSRVLRDGWKIQLVEISLVAGGSRSSARPSSKSVQGCSTFLRALWSRLWTCHRLTNARLRVAWAISTALF